jgi:L-alanine-DL-glutamate epimerase-like enolase superfamily enzyme
VALEDVVLPQLRRVDLADAGAVAAALQKVPENRLAKAIVDNACWTLRAAVAGKPLWQMWGGQREVEMCWMVTRQSPARMVFEAGEACVAMVALLGGKEHSRHTTDALFSNQAFPRLRHRAHGASLPLRHLLVEVADVVPRQVRFRRSW